MVEEGGLHRRQGQLFEKSIADLHGLAADDNGTFLSQERQPDVHRFGVYAKALGSVEVRQAVRSKALDKGRQRFIEIYPSVEVAHENPEAIAVQMPRAKLVTMTADVEDADAVAF